MAFATVLLPGFLIVPSTSKAAPAGTEATVVELVNPIGGTRSNPRGINEVSNETVIAELVARVIAVMLGLVGSLALLVFVYGGFVWVTSAGNQQRVSTGWHAMIYSAIGLFVVFSAYAILTIVIRTLTGTT